MVEFLVAPTYHVPPRRAVIATRRRFRIER
jgi:hypothetical protein